MIFPIPDKWPPPGAAAAHAATLPDADDEIQRRAQRSVHGLNSSRPRDDLNKIARFRPLHARSRISSWIPAPAAAPWVWGHHLQEIWHHSEVRKCPRSWTWTQRAIKNNLPWQQEILESFIENLVLMIIVYIEAKRIILWTEPMIATWAWNCQYCSLINFNLNIFLLMYCQLSYFYYIRSSKNTMNIWLF